MVRQASEFISMWETGWKPHCKKPSESADVPANRSMYVYFLFVLITCDVITG